MSAARSSFDGADILFGNLESTLVAPMAGDANRASLQMRGNPRFATDLKRAGFDVLNVANNHAVQHGDETFFSTVATVRAAGIVACGVRGTDGWASEPALVEASGTRIGFLAYCARPRQYGQAVPPYAEGTPEEIRADVARLRSTGVSVVVSMHWGEEFVPVPSEGEVSLGRSIIDAGASLIIGHHPHVTRAAERYKNGVIAYSLGNFIGDMTWYAPFRTGSILRASITEGGVEDAAITPTRLSHDYRPTIAGAAIPIGDTQMQGMRADEYTRAIDETISRQRMAAYRYAVVNLRRTPVPILKQLVTQTISNKLSGVGARLFGR
jgi:poly-gamma-glutamate synthesis protein (capsule biosynthesis protein)